MISQINNLNIPNITQSTSPAPVFRGNLKSYADAFEHCAGYSQGTATKSYNMLSYIAKAYQEIASLSKKERKIKYPGKYENIKQDRQGNKIITTVPGGAIHKGKKYIFTHDAATGNLLGCSFVKHDIGENGRFVPNQGYTETNLFGVPSGAKVIKIEDMKTKNTTTITKKGDNTYTLVHSSQSENNNLSRSRTDRNGNTETHIYVGSNRPVREEAKIMPDGSKKTVSVMDSEGHTIYNEKDKSMTYMSDEIKKYLEKHFKETGVFTEKGLISGGHTAEYYEKIGRGEWLKRISVSKDGKTKTYEIPMIIRKNEVDTPVKGTVSITDDNGVKHFVFRNGNEDIAHIKGPIKDSKTGTLYYESYGKTGKSSDLPPKSVVPEEVFNTIDLDNLPKGGECVWDEKERQYVYLFMTQHKNTSYCFAAPMNGKTLYPITSTEVDKYEKGLFEKLKSNFEKGTIK